MVQDIRYKELLVLPNPLQIKALEDKRKIDNSEKSSQNNNSKALIRGKKPKS